MPNARETHREAELPTQPGLEQSCAAAGTLQQQGTTPACVTAALDVTAPPEPSMPRLIPPGHGQAGTKGDCAPATPRAPSPSCVSAAGEERGDSEFSVPLARPRIPPQKEVKKPRESVPGKATCCGDAVVTLW